MKTFTTTKDFLKFRKTISSKTLSLVPTMGNIHQGHISLINTAKKKSDLVIVSLFVNPIQFKSIDDYHAYPNTLYKDKDILAKEDVDILFCPQKTEIFPEEFNTSVVLNKFVSVLEGTYRPGHMEGVATIVTKLFNITNPDLAIFGEKDFQQLMLIKSLSKDLNFPIKIISSKIVRDSNGLALSSRNNFLSKNEKFQAYEIFKALAFGCEEVSKGEKLSENIVNLIKKRLSNFELIRLEYVSVRNPNTFEELQVINGDYIILIAAFVGKTRLIDNLKYVEKNDRKKIKYIK